MIQQGQKIGDFCTHMVDFADAATYICTSITKIQLA